MAITAKRINVIDFSGDVVLTDQFPAADNTTSPGVIDLTNLNSGFNSIAVKTNSRAVLILPPLGNAVTMTLKGITGDTGINIHPTDPTAIALATGQATIGISCGSAITGMRLVWI
jgi:hypothetical protein